MQPARACVFILTSILSQCYFQPVFSQEVTTAAPKISVTWPLGMLTCWKNPQGALVIVDVRILRIGTKKVYLLGARYVVPQKTAKA